MNIRLASTLVILVAVSSGCGQKSSEESTSVAERPALAADVELASGDDQRILEACTQVAALSEFLKDGSDDWPGTAAKSQPWYSEKNRASNLEELERLWKWIVVSNPEGIKDYVQILRMEQWLPALADNGWADAKPDTPFPMTQARWLALENRLLLCASLSKGKSVEQVSAPAPEPESPPDLGTPALIIEVQPE